MSQYVSDHLLPLTMGAILIAFGAFAINDPESVIARVCAAVPSLCGEVSTDKVRTMAVVLLLLGSVGVLASITLQAGPILGIRAVPR